MTIQLAGPAVDTFDPDPAIQECLRDSKRKRRPGFVDSEPKIKMARLQTVDLPVGGGEFIVR